VKRECLALISEGMKEKKSGIGPEKCLLEFLCYLLLKCVREGGLARGCYNT
jgi:hypothetical protein